jgi:anti-sigma factor RsiW
VTCRECAEFLSDYLAGELSVEVRATFERHLTLCPNCETYLEQLRETIIAGQRAFEDDPGAPEPEIPEELIRAILAARRQG